MFRLLICLFLLAPVTISGAWAEETVEDTLITSARSSEGDVVPYILTKRGQATVSFVLILMPGGSGNLDPEMIDGQISFKFGGNFLIRSRGLFADGQTVAISTNATANPEKIKAVVADALHKFPGAKVFILGTSRSTESTMQLAVSMDGLVAGFIHTSSMSSIVDFDTTNLKSRQLIVHHVNDECKVTPYASAVYNHSKFGTTLVSMEGGISSGNYCEGSAHHGYNGIEQETVAKIKEWIARDGR